MTMSPTASATSTTSPLEKPIITNLNNYDVLLGRDKQCFNHAGNRHFRDYISGSVSVYLDAPTRADKSLVVNGLMFGIQELGGRFLKRAPGSSSKSEWTEVEDKYARDKCSHAVRDAANTMAKRGTLAQPQAQKAAQVSTRLARVLRNDSSASSSSSHSSSKKRQMKKSLSSTSTASTTATSIGSSSAAAPIMSSKPQQRQRPMVVPSSPTTTPAAPMQMHMTMTSSTPSQQTRHHSHNTRNKGIVNTMAVVSDSDSSYGSDDESFTASPLHIPSSGDYSTATTTTKAAPSLPMINNNSNNNNNMNSMFAADVFFTTTAQNIHKTFDNNNTNHLLLSQELEDDRCWFEPNDFASSLDLSLLPLENDHQACTSALEDDCCWEFGNFDRLGEEEIDLAL